MPAASPPGRPAASTATAVRTSEPDKAKKGTTRRDKDAQERTRQPPLMPRPCRPGRNSRHKKKRMPLFMTSVHFVCHQGRQGKAAHAVRAQEFRGCGALLSSLPARAMLPAQQSSPGRSASFPKHAPERVVSPAGSALLAQPARPTAQGHFPPSWRHAVRDGA